MDIKQEKQELEVLKRRKKPERYYTIAIKGMHYGTLIRKANEYKEALKIYHELKQAFYLFNCNVVLSKHVIEIDENGVEHELTTIISNPCIGNDFNIKLQLENILAILDSLDNMKKIYTNTYSESDKYVSAVRHVLEETNTEDLSNETIRQIIRGMEEKGALRRISKKQLDYINALVQNVSSIRSNVNKALETCKKMDYHNSTEKAKQNSEAKSHEYRDILGLDINI